MHAADTDASVAPGRSTDIVIAAMLTRAPDPNLSASKVGLACDPARANNLTVASAEQLYDYMKPWHETLHAHPGLHGLVLYDQLSPGFVERWRSPQVEFQTYEVGPRYRESTSAVIQRVSLLLNCLDARPDIARAWFTDINDVGFVSNPFHWMDQFSLGEDWLFAGEEWTTFRKNDWFARHMRYLGGKYLELFSGRFADMYLINMGIWGGRRAAMQEFAREFLREIDRLLDAGFDLLKHPGACADMPVMNLLMYTRFFSRVVTFNMEAHVGQIRFEPGAFIRSAGNPVMHDRPLAVKVIDEINASRSLKLRG